ncbi:hypothetical protein [Aeromonas enterica]|jgi:hypothetical protein
MAVPNKPFLLSAAYGEFGGNRWMSDTANRAGLPAPCWLGELAGRSAATVFNMVVAEWEPGQGDTAFGFWAGANGSISPSSYQGLVFQGLYGTDYDSNLYVYLVGAAPDLNLTIVGAGTVTIPANNGTIPMAVPWPGIGEWLAARVGQTVQISIAG